MTDLQTGIARLSATAIDDGYVYRDDNAQGWYVVGVDAVEAAGRMEPWDYSAWCADHDADEATRAQLVEAGITIPSGMAHDAGTWYLAPRSDRSDEWAAGYDANTFASREDAEAAIASLRACGGEFATDWVAVQRPEVRS